jgi:hypothetical protein
VSEDRCNGSDTWTIAVETDDCELLELVLELVPYVYVCEDCNGETCGVVFHAQPWADREDIERSLFAEEATA